MKKTLADAKVLVTGAGGFIGSHLCEFCLESGAEVRAFVHYNSRGHLGMLEDLDRKKLRKIEVIAGDLRDPSAVRHAVRGCNIVFHLGAQISIPYSYANPEDVVGTNVLGTLHVLQAARESGVDRLVQTSSSEVYGTAESIPMDESHPLKPHSPYAASKIASDKLTESYFRTYGLPVTILRPFNTYGPRQSPRAVVPTIVGQALCSSTIRLGSLYPSRDLVFVADTVKGFLSASSSKASLGQTVQLGSNSEVSIADLTKLIGKIIGKKLRVVSEVQRRRPKNSEVDRLCGSNQLARRLLGWAPQVPLDVGLAKTVSWFQDRNQFFKQDVYHV